MRLYHLVAMARRRVIGKNNRMPWHFSSDLRHFKALTMGSTVIMGRKTFESIGEPLAGRENFVLSRTAPSKDIPGIHFFDSLEKAFERVATPEAFIIGGEDLYRQTLGRIDGIYLTEIDAEYDGDAFYPEIPPSFKEKSRKTLQEHPKIEVIFYEQTHG